jgi:AsmA protein
MKRIVRLFAIVLGVFLIAIFSLPFLIDANQFRPMLESTMTKALARNVKLGSLKLAILSGGVTADDLSIVDDPAFSRTPFLRTKSLALGVDLWPLVFSRKLHITRLTIDQPQINLLQSDAGDWNISSLGGKSDPRVKQPPEPPATGGGLDLSVKLVRITNGRLSVAQMHGGGRPGVLENVNLEVRDFSSSTAFPFTLSGKIGSGGDIKLSGSAGPINSTDAAATPVKLNLKISQLNLANAGLAESSAGLAGLLTLDGAGASNGRTISLNGAVKIDHLKLASNGSPAREPVQFDFSVEHDLRKRSGVLRHGAIHIGSALASIGGTYAQHGESMVVDMNLSGPQMPVPQLAAMLPAMGIVLPAGSSLQGGTADAKLAFQGPAALMVTSGYVALNNTRLAGFDLASKVSTVAKLAGIKTSPDTDIQVFATNLRMAPEGMTAQDIKLVAPAVGALTGSGTVSPAHALDFKMRAALHASASVAAALGQSGDAGIPFLIEGTASNPIFRPDVKAFAEEKIKGLEKGDLGKTASGLIQGIFGKKKKQ